MKKATCTLQKLYPVSKCDDCDNVFHSVLLSKTLTPLTPVSYTHLDVYKRQEQYLSGILFLETLLQSLP